MPTREMNQKVAVSVVFVAAMFMNLVDVTIVNVALPTLGREFHVRPDSVDLVAIAYLVSLAVFIPVSGWLGDRFGGKTILLTSIVIFTGASALCGLSSSLAELVGFRVLQGVGGGLMVPVGMALQWRTFPPAERIRAASILLVPTAFAPAIGPVLGGVLVTEVSWRWVFYLNLPIGIAAFCFGMVFLREQREHQAGSFDLGGFLLAASGLALVMYGVSEGPFHGWGTPLVALTVAVGAVLLVGLVTLELKVRHPMIDVRLTANRLFRSCIVVLGLGVAAFLGLLFLVALFFQDGLGLSALQSGLSTFPEAVGVMIGAQVVTRFLYPVVGPRRVMALGLVLAAAMMLLMTRITAGTSLWWMRLLMFFAGYGMSHVFVPSQAAGFATISSAETGRASTIFNAVRQLGGALGVAVLSSVVAAIGPVRTSGHRVGPNLSAYHTAFAVAAALAVLAALAALTVNDTDAAPTMVRRNRKPAEHREVEAAAASP